MDAREIYEMRLQIAVKGVIRVIDDVTRAGGIAAFTKFMLRQFRAKMNV